jgi:hypothetical protein
MNPHCCLPARYKSHCLLIRNALPIKIRKSLMAIEANYDPLDFFTADELAEYYELLGEPDEPIEDKIPEEKEKAPFICVLREPVVNSIKALPRTDNRLC